MTSFVITTDAQRRYPATNITPTLPSSLRGEGFGWGNAFSLIRISEIEL
jgi:hypothetical protein